MTAVPIGELNQIHRYPVKSFGGESLETCSIETYGLYGDRFCAFYDATKAGWDSFFTARAIPPMLTYHAAMDNEAVRITSPDGRILGWNEDLLDEMQKFSKRKMSLLDYRAPNPENPDLMSVDAASILIITDDRLRELEAMLGKTVDARRFRANLIISVNEHAGSEQDWIGKRLLIGNAELQVDTFCERCSMITLDPDTLERDVAVLKKVNEAMGLNFGVYASVKKPGSIHIQDKVYLVD